MSDENPDDGDDRDEDEIALDEVEPALAEALEPPPDVGMAEAYEQRARLAEDRLAEVLGAYRGLRTETEALRERTTRNLERKYEQRRERLLLRFIDLLDNFDRALDAAAQSGSEPMIQGLILVRTQLLQTLKEEGLERIPVLGFPYDPHVAEAVATHPVEDPEQDQIVVRELLRGYRLKDRIARPARVLVGAYTAPAPVPPPSAPAPVELPPPEPAAPAQDPEAELAALLDAPAAPSPLEPTPKSDEISLDDLLTPEK